METDGPEMETDGPEMETDGPEMETAENTQPETDGPEMETSENAKLETETAGPETEPDDSGAPEMETSFSNPWNVSDLSLFLRYCCPECDYKCEGAHLFCEHALDFHRNSNVLLENLRDKKSQTNVKQERSDDYNESFEVVQDFDDFENEYNLNEEPKGQLILE